MPHSIPVELEQFTPEDLAEILRATPHDDLRKLNATFSEWAHDGQLPPPGDWRVWVMMAGRGFGKTLSGAEWVLGLVRGGGPSGWTAASRRTPHPARALRESPPRPSIDLRSTEPLAALPSPTGGEGAAGLRIALVAGTVDEARAVMVEGPSGILARARAGEVADWSFQRRTVDFANGATATLFSGANPEALRGPEHDFAWCDELAKWRHGEATWSNLQLGLRRGTHPRALVTTTPRRDAALRAVLDEDGVVVTRGASADNPHVSAAWLGAMQRMHGGTTLGRQELGGELLGEVEGALWPRTLIEGCRGSPAFARDARAPMQVVLGVDPPAMDTGAACGIVAAGRADGTAYVLGDHSVAGLSPDGWARKVAAAADMWGAACVIAEANNGGKMVEAVLRAGGVAVPVRLVHAAEGKVARAAPVAALFERGVAKFAGVFPELEDELAGLSWGGSVGKSPDRADAMVWALTHLMLGPARAAEPGVRGL